MEPTCYLVRIRGRWWIARPAATMWYPPKPKADCADPAEPIEPPRIRLCWVERDGGAILGADGDEDDVRELPEE